MNRVKAYIRLLKWKINQNAKINSAVYTETVNEEELLTDFNFQPHLGWMKEEKQSAVNS